MPKSYSDWSEIVGLLLIAVAVGALSGAWWGVLAGGVELVLLGIATGRTRAPSDTPGDG